MVVKDKGPDCLMASEIQGVLEELAARALLDDRLLNPAETAFLFAMSGHPGLSLGRFFSHVKKLGKALRDNEGQALADVAEKARHLQQVFCVEQGYEHDADEEHICLANDLIHVVSQRAGSDLALVILALAAARAAGWRAEALSLAGYYILRLEGENGQGAMIDIADGCRMLQAPDLRRIVKVYGGEGAELSASYYEPVAARGLLMALQNRVKFRQIEEENYEGALQTVALMKAFAPQEYRLLFEEGILCARLGYGPRAEEALEGYIARAPRDRDRHEAAALLQQVRRDYSL